MIRLAGVLFVGHLVVQWDKDDWLSSRDHKQPVLPIVKLDRMRFIQCISMPVRKGAID